MTRVYLREDQGLGLGVFKHSIIEATTFNAGTVQEYTLCHALVSMAPVVMF